MRLGGQEIVLGGWLDVAWGLEAGFWSLVAGFGRPGGPHNLKIGASSGFWQWVLGQLGGGRWGVWKLATP